MIKVEKIDVWGFEHAVRGMPAKGYRKTKNGTYETFISNKSYNYSLGTYQTEEEAITAVYSYRINRFKQGCEKLNINPYEGKEYQKNYIAFPSGHILNLHGKEMIGAIGKDGYRHVIINGKNINVHRIIAELFVQNPNDYNIVNHINGIKTDNRAVNLEWCTASDNVKHAYQTGLEQRVYGERHHASKITDADVRYIRSHYIKRDKQFGATALGKQFNLDRTTITDIINGKTWRHVT